MSYFNSNITGGAAGGLVTKFVKTIAISSSELAEVTINISSDVSNCKDVTNERIIGELNDVSAIAAGDAKLNHTYDAETGIITITSTNSSIPFASSSTVELSVNVYIAGAVQLQPDVPSQGRFKLYNGEIITSQIAASKKLQKVAYAIDLPIGKELLIFAEAKFNVTPGHNCTISIQNETGNILATRTESAWGYLSLCNIIINNQDTRLNMLVSDASGESAQSMSNFTFKLYEAI